jgi:ferric-dicitrate binding protein FerR (iron transport regulator)
MLSFEGAPLGEVARELNRYNRSKIEILDRNLVSLMLGTGNYPVRKPEQFLGDLLHVHPLRISVIHREGGEGIAYQLQEGTGPENNPLYGARLDEIALAFNLFNERPHFVVEENARGAAVNLNINLKRPDEFIRALERSGAVKVTRQGDRVVIESR